MTTGKVVLVTMLAGAISIGIAIFGQQFLDEGKGLKLPLRSPRDAGADGLDALPAFRLPDISGQEIASDRWAGKVLVLNFWATWCPPCLRELPMFDELLRTHSNAGLQVVGIAIDKKEDVERFLAENPVGYPILLGNTDAVEMSRRLGNRLQGLPYTLIFDRRGKRVYGQIGEVTRASLSERLEPLLSQETGERTFEN
jgi:thiol-disulfide isomerase/thioredoxin